jgi:tetratricopeptide (TPR) repeat protein/tRNA A-37 threonylcarbamoyl transferase component Bud32
MMGKTISHYKILEKLGEGGMGEVFKAQDLDLDRTVALKFLKHPSLSDEAERKRFQREAQAAAALDHPNICTIYEIGQTDGATFIAMAYLGGFSLQERIRSGPLDLKQAVDIAIQIADGLDAAHNKGIVHRDVKSANVVGTESGQAKITDFGLALREGQSRMTRPGYTVGTSVYMSPEQCRGDEVDRRTDIWSLGVVLYEMVTGCLPFDADHDSAVVYAILNEDPEPITARRSRVPLELERVVDKLLSKDPAERYQHADEVAADLKRLQRLIESSTDKKVAATTGHRRRFTSRVPWILVAGAAVVAAAVIVFFPSRSVPFTERGWMIIADFDNETGEEVFDGIVSEALSIDMQQAQYVNVFPRQRIDQTLKRMGQGDVSVLDERTAGEVAEREGVDAVLAGAINRVGTSYILTASIVIPSTGDVVKTVRAEADDPEDVLNAIDDLSRSVRRDLGESLASIWRHDKPLATVTTSSLPALRFYTAAAKHMTDASWDDAIPLFKQAIEEDSSFAIAYSKLGVIYSNLNDLEKAREYSGMARERAHRVTDRERYYIEARYFEDRANRKNAIENYKLLVQLYPDDFYGQNNLAFRYQFSYQYEEALEHAREAARLQPQSWYPHYNLGAIYAGMGEYGPAIDHIGDAKDINPDGYWANIALSWIHCCRDDAAAGLEELDKLPADDEYWQSLRLLNIASLYRGIGRNGAALSHLQQGISFDELAGNATAQSWKWLTIAEIKTAEGDLEEAVVALQRAVGLSRSAANLMYLGAGYAAVGSFEDAQTILVELEEPWPWEKSDIDVSMIERLKGEFAMTRGQYDEAVQFFERSLILWESLEVRYRLGLANRLAGRYDKAIAEFEFVTGKRYGTFFDNSPELWPLSQYQLGISRQAAGDTAAAATAFERFLTVWQGADADREELADARTRLDSLR